MRHHLIHIAHAWVRRASLAFLRPTFAWFLLSCGLLTVGALVIRVGHETLGTLVLALWTGTALGHLLVALWKGWR